MDEKLLVINIDSNKSSKLDKIKKEMTSKEKIDFMVEEANYKIMTYFKEPSLMKEYLDYMAKFYNYSARNLALIEDQFEGAMAVGSFKFWSDNGFKVNKGEKGIKILVPTKITYLLLGDKEKQLKYATKEEKEKVKKGLIKTREKIFYKTGYVFDISQTNAKSSDLPKLFPNKWLDGDVKDYDKLYEAMEKIAESIDVKIIEPKDELGAVKGVSYPMTKEVALNPRNSQLQNVKTLLHELAHAKLHTMEKRDDYFIQEREYQAEMVAYTTCSYFGIDTSDYSLDYLYNWTKNMDFDECLEIIKEVKETSSEYIKIIDDYMNENIDISLENEVKKEEKNIEKIENKNNEDTLTVDNVYVKFISSKAKEIDKGDIYDLKTANELVSILSEKYVCLDKPMSTQFELHSNLDCNKVFYSGSMDIGNGLDYDLKNHLYKNIKRNMNLDKKTKNTYLKLFSPQKTKKIEMEM
ncbi:ImmA/IrrE family metallo-endopeptidase [Clostridioides difficile]|uniref:ImmA/IrrE family metallo-endopeptidase n=1 Tax=Clostridioides difficile TaxID=1496 RepID=UPI001FF11357|nr:ImmA/IrrE family metallo-endopeptidase [Clostridioides difficile]